MVNKKWELAKLDELLDSFQKSYYDGREDDILTGLADQIFHQLNKVHGIVSGNHTEKQEVQRKRQGFEQLVVKIVAKRHAPLLAARFMRYKKSHH